MKRKLLYSTLFGCTLLFSCSTKPENPTAEPYSIVGDTVHIANGEVLKNKIKLDRVSQELVASEVVTAGTIQAIPTQYAYIAPPFAGRVVRSYIKLGEKVKQNTPLFDIISSEYTTAQKEYFQAESDRDLAKLNLDRQKDLMANGVGSQKENEEASNALFIAEKEYENASMALQVFQTNPSQMTLGEPLVVRSPIAGDVIENSIVTGQFISSETDPVAVIANLDKVWIVAQVKEKDIRFIHQGDKIEVQIAALPNHPIEGTVYYIDESIDMETRSIKVLSVCDNYDKQLKLGMYATIHFTDQPKPSLVVPEKAILQGEDHSYIYVEVKENMFIPCPVHVESTHDGKAIITGDLKKGDVIVSEGGYYFK